MPNPLRNAAERQRNELGSFLRVNILHLSVTVAGNDRIVADRSFVREGIGLSVNRHGNQEPGLGDIRKRFRRNFGNDTQIKNLLCGAVFCPLVNIRALIAEQCSCGVVDVHACAYDP